MSVLVSGKQRCVLVSFQTPGSSFVICNPLCKYAPAHTYIYIHLRTNTRPKVQASCVVPISLAPLTPDSSPAELGSRRTLQRLSVF